MRDLSSLNNEELKDFFNSFDTVLSDIDGVVWTPLTRFVGADDAVRSLKKIGKRVIFVTNNTTKAVDVFCEEFKKANFDVDPDDIVIPNFVTISYLKKQNLSNKKIFVLGMPFLKEGLKKAGFDVAENFDRKVKDVTDFCQVCTEDDRSVGVVISDIALNLNYVNLQKAITYLERPDVIFLKGATDKRIPVGPNKSLAGPGYWLAIIEEVSGREAILMAKPSPYLNDYILEKYKNDKSRTLFIGDAIPADMGFAANCGYKKLLVLSGVSKREHVENWQDPEDLKPDFYVDSLKVVNDLIARIYQ